MSTGPIIAPLDEDRRGRTPLPGSVPGICVKCFRRVWLCIEGQRLLQEHPRNVYCSDCYVTQIAEPGQRIFWAGDDPGADQPVMRIGTKRRSS